MVAIGQKKEDSTNRGGGERRLELPTQVNLASKITASRRRKRRTEKKKTLQLCAHGGWK